MSDLCLELQRPHDPGGGARTRSLHPFVFPELRDSCLSLERVMKRGLLPPHYLSDTPDGNLAVNVDTYLTEEGLDRLPASSHKALSEECTPEGRAPMRGYLACREERPQGTDQTGGRGCGIFRMKREYP